ncbi:RXT2-like protein [Annulohypoxylon maeteangense]|uniref:RXT2-like protein n=1 Tax=Annulohypoxylon maeteangense TaxID=1927788 RepID=UPI0020073CD4|nr:RXT2-like protein [Annulohypoxylon maeteangense]KAI0887963.1 RXT2-like protein [Annulohypoxylon maeteangense]
MTTQQVLFSETIAAMKKARKRKAYESDSDEEIYYHGNRGHKLMKRARFVHEGQLAPPSGPEVYKEIVNHAGYQRAIISRNPVLIDDEGYEIDSDDDQDYIQDVTDTAAEFNPYANVRLENILAPLTTVTDLPTHPTLSRSYTTKTLTNLAKQGCNIMQKENAALWKVKHLQTKLVGDHIWAPCEVMLGPNDIEFYRDDYMDYNSQAPGSVKSDANTLSPEDARAKASRNAKAAAKDEVPTRINGKLLINGERSENGDTTMADAEPPADPNTLALESETQSGKTVSEDNIRDTAVSNSTEKSLEISMNENGQSATADIINGAKELQIAENASGPATNNATAPAKQGEAEKAAQIIKGAEHGDSRAVSVMSEFTDDPPIHPLFLPPRSAHPDRDLGIPEAEAEDMRRLLQLYVQKQEEVCRGAKRLYEGLLRADRMRKTVLQWAKYEAHVGPNRDMSDGEDWYDKEEWGLEDDLKKGQDEEEEDTTQTTKKTRTRR